jgi:hypothetical protein
VSPAVLLQELLGTSFDEILLDLLLLNGEASDTEREWWLLGTRVHKHRRLRFL